MWLDTVDNCPDWQDGGKRIAVKKGEDVQTGILRLYDVGFDGEDEYPIWEIEIDGERHSFFDFDWFRYVDITES